MVQNTFHLYQKFYAVLVQLSKNDIDYYKEVLVSSLVVFFQSLVNSYITCLFLEILKPKDYPLFVKTLMEITNVDSLESLRDRFITDTEWSTVSKKMNVCRNHLKICWKSSLYTKIFHNGPIQVDNIMRKLIAKYVHLPKTDFIINCFISFLLYRLDETEEDDYRKLNWTKLAEPFKPVTRAFLYRIFKRVQSNTVPPHMQTNLRSKCKYLCLPLRIMSLILYFRPVAAFSIVCQKITVPDVRTGLLCILCTLNNV